MLSAYQMMLIHLEARWQPLLQQMILLITLSMNIANRQGDRMMPWRTPTDNLKKGVVMEPQRTQVIDDRNQFSMMHKSLANRALCSILSNALDKSKAHRLTVEPPSLY